MAFRTHNFSLRLTDQEIANYERLASESGVSVSEWARGVLNERVRHDLANAGKRREGETINHHFYERVTKLLNERDNLKGEKS